MPELSKPVGLGLAARGNVADAVAWAEQARRAGLDSVWLHDSYFERDAVTYASAIAAQVGGVRVGLGALNPLTRHPVVVAMTVSAIDDMAPGRVILGMGTGLPLRLAQMGIPYSREAGVQAVSRAIDAMRALWSGERVPPGTAGVPPVQPMFPPVHRVPIYIAAYRSAFLELAGQKADGYLARPAESIASLRQMLPTMRSAAVAAGRPEDAVQVAGYLLTLVDSSRREALNRAKREPFVIYMMSVQSDLAMRRAGLDPELKDRIGAAWRAEDYHSAASLIPDELLDAFMLCGTREEVAARAAAYHQAGMDLPLLQPVLQEDGQVREVLGAAVEYGRGAAPAAVPVPAPVAGAPAPPTGAHATVSAAPGAGPAHPSPPAAPSRQERWQGVGARLSRRLGAWIEIARPFSFTASTVPVAAGGALAALDRRLDPLLFLGALIASMLLHVGTNVINEIYDVRKGIDSITSPRASHALLKGRLAEREAFALAAVAFTGAAAIGLWLVAARGWPVAVLGLMGLIGGLGYTAPPLAYKFHALGPPLVFLLMGPLMVVGAYYVSSGALSWGALLASLPVGLLVTAILHGNEWRDLSEDARAGISTLSIRAGRRAAHSLYLSLVVGAYLVLSLAVAVHALPAQSMLAMLSLPLLVRAIRSSELGASGQQRAIAMIDLETAQLHAVFGFLLVAGIALAAVLR
ncbi:MAG TPA: LLM class flavin-dependent oxidoreductase [Actinomycetota bacterium]|nr:LLM class flavin-dependent oxidoreductase [Actinomycetota bacterium]